MAVSCPLASHSEYIDRQPCPSVCLRACGLTESYGHAVVELVARKRRTYVVVEAEHASEIAQSGGATLTARLADLLDLVVDGSGRVGGAWRRRRHRHATVARTAARARRLQARRTRRRILQQRNSPAARGSNNELLQYWQPEAASLSSVATDVEFIDRRQASADALRITLLTTSSIHRVKRRHRIYGHDTMASFVGMKCRNEWR